MQKDNAQTGSPLSLPQQAYVLANSLRSIIRNLTIFFVGIIAYFSLGIILNDPLFWLVASIILLSPFLIAMIIKSRRIYGELNTWNKEYLQSSYTLIFDTTIPKGNTTGEKVLNLASLIFPQLRADYIDYYYTSNFLKSLFKRKSARAWKEKLYSSLNYRVGQEYNLDVALKTLEGYFIVKDFGDSILSVENLKELIEIVGNKFRDKYRQLDVFRIIVVAKEYDQPFLNRESLEQMMRGELGKMDIDLVVQEQVGYTVLWIS
ncbi:MAG: hypothetical protein WA941_18395 [Nitrososphaeraceae archaeon]